MEKNIFDFEDIYSNQQKNGDELGPWWIFYKVNIHNITDSILSIYPKKDSISFEGFEHLRTLRKIEIDTILNYQEPIGFCLYMIMIILFAFFYSNLQIDAKKISDDLKKNGGSIPGVRTGKDTENYIKRVLNRVTVVGAIFLMIISAIPVFTQVVWAGSSSNTLSLGGTGLIIITGVALETTKQIKTMITRKEYHGYIRK